VTTVKRSDMHRRIAENAPIALRIPAMKLVGLTGGIASGKSTVGRMLAKAGVPVVDADVLAREAVAPGSDGLRAVVERFGTGVLAADGSLDRKALGAIIFHDVDARRDLNLIVHPRVAQLAVERLAALRESVHHEIAVYEVPLLFENGLEGMVDTTLLVAVSPEVQRARLMARDNAGPVDADARIASQMSLEEKRAKADHVLENDGTVDDTARRLAVVWRAISGRDVAFLP
jgi:dephospho-CoA kinase